MPNATSCPGGRWRERSYRFLVPVASTDALSLRSGPAWFCTLAPLHAIGQ